MSPSTTLTRKYQGLMQETESVLKKVKSIGKNENKKTGFCIGNTTKKVDHDYFFTPIRDTAKCVSGSIIIDKVAIAEVVTQVIDGEVDYIFVDTEKKISAKLYSAHDAGNVERAVRTLAKKSKILTYKGNDITVDAIDCFLAQLMNLDERGLGGKKVAVIGAGNMGFKVALKLTERGANVVMVRRNTKKLETIVQALNYIKPENTIAKIAGTSDIKTAMTDADVVIGLTPGTQDITAEMVSRVSPHAFLIDAGKGSFSQGAIAEAESRGLVIYRTSVMASFEGQVAMLLKMEEILEKSVGRREIEGIPIVSGGLLGRKGEIVVDNIFEPIEVFGVADGLGDFIHALSTKEKLSLDRIKEILHRASKMERVFS